MLNPTNHLHATSGPLFSPIAIQPNFRTRCRHVWADSRSTRPDPCPPPSADPQSTAPPVLTLVQPLAQIRLKGTQLRYPRLTRTVVPRLQASRDVSTHCLTVELHPARDGRYAVALAVQFKIMTISPSLPKQKRGHHRASAPGARQDPDAQSVSPWGISTGTSGVYSPGTHTRPPESETMRSLRGRDGAGT